MLKEEDITKVALMELVKKLQGQISSLEAKIHTLESQVKQLQYDVRYNPGR